MHEVGPSNRAAPGESVIVVARLRVDHRVHAEQTQRRTQPQRGLEPRFGPGDRGVQARQGRRPRAAAQHLPHEVELHHKAGRGRGPAELRQQPVVATALRHRPPEVGAVALEDDPRVVVEVSDRAEVEAHDVAESVRLE